MEQKPQSPYSSSATKTISHGRSTRRQTLLVIVNTEHLRMSCHFNAVNHEGRAVFLSSNREGAPNSTSPGTDSSHRDCSR